MSNRDVYGSGITAERWAADRDGGVLCGAKVWCGVGLELEVQLPDPAVSGLHSVARLAVRTDDTFGNYNGGETLIDLQIRGRLEQATIATAFRWIADRLDGEPLAGPPRDDTK